MPAYCVVPLCTERTSGHKFPRDENLRKRWIIAIRRAQFEPSEYSRVCRKHFKSDDYVLPKESIMENPVLLLKNDAIPSKFPWNEEIPEKKKKREDRAQRLRNRNNRKEKKMHDYENIQQHETTVEASIPAVEVEIESSHKYAETQCCLCLCKKTPSPMNTNKSVPKFRIENFLDQSKSKQIQFYTGFDDYKHFMFVFNLFGEEVNHLLYYPSKIISRRSRALNPCNEFFMTIMKLRHNISNTELSFHFEISEVSVSNIFITWINYLYCKFKQLDLWVDKGVLDENMKFRGKPNSCTVIIDCTEIKIEKPKNPISQQATYSTYKSTNTLKVLVGISASGTVTFVSDAYGGSISDRELFQRSGLINKLQPGDIILADRGFNIQDLVCHKDVIVNMPEFLRNRNQLAAHQLRTSKKISSERIHVERVIGLGKTYKILANRLSSTLVPLGGRIIFVCFMLTNFRSSICK